MTHVVELSIALDQTRIALEQMRDVAERRRQLKASREAHWWHLFHDDELSALEIESKMHQLFLDRGASVEEADRLTASHDTIQRVVGTRSNPTPRPEETQ